MARRAIRWESSGRVKRISWWPSSPSQGYATLRGAIDDHLLREAEDELVRSQHQLAEGRLDPRHGTVVLDDPDATVDGQPFAHYVCFATRASPAADALVNLPPLVEVVRRLLGTDAWLLDYEQFGVVYQDARPGPTSGYSRIGWHTDHQSGPHLDIWPGVAFTVHFDPHLARPTAFCGCCPAAIVRTPKGFRSGSNVSPARSPSIKNGATSCSTMPTSGTPPPGPPPMTSSPSVDTSAAVGTGAPNSRSATGPTTS